MKRSKSAKRIYLGPVLLNRQPRSWIKKHRSFASKEWFEGHVRYGKWIREPNKPNYYRIYAEVLDGIKPIRVLIKIKYEGTHVLVFHAHIIKSRI